MVKMIREELFEHIAGWTRGSQYHIVTLQAVMANDLDGDTIHHALGLNWQRREILRLKCPSCAKALAHIGRNQHGQC